MNAELQSTDWGSVVQRRATREPVEKGGWSVFRITEQTRTSIQDWLSKVDASKAKYLSPSRFRAQPHLSTRQYARIVHGWVDSAGQIVGVAVLLVAGPRSSNERPIPRCKTAANVTKTCRSISGQQTPSRVDYCPSPGLTRAAGLRRFRTFPLEST